MSLNIYDPVNKVLIPIAGNSRNVVQGATESADGVAGLVPSPTSADIGKFLKGDGSWGTPEGDLITTKVSKSGTAGSSITSSVNANTSMDNVVETMLDNDKTLDTNVSSLKETFTTQLSGKAPTSHASTDTTYGVGSATNYGHVKVDSTPTANSTNAISSGAVNSLKETFTTQLSGKAPTNHASTDTTYGVGNATNYGHVKVDSTPTANSTNAISSGAVNSLKETLTQQIDIDGCKNHYRMPWSDFVSNGITYQDNGDKTITANGTVTSTPSFSSNPKGNITGLIVGETYVLSGLPDPTTISGGSSAEAYIKLYKNDWTYSDIRTKGSKTLTFTYDGTNAMTVDIGIRGVGTVATNAVFKPMICLKSLYDADPTFAPYAKSNRELTKDVVAIVPHIMKVVQVSGVNIFDILSNLNSYPAKTEYFGYSCTITNGSSTLGNLLSTGDYGIVSIKKYDEWYITISVISGNSMGKTHMAAGNKNSTSIKFVNNDPGASTDKVTTTTINKAT